MRRRGARLAAATLLVAAAVALSGCTSPRAPARASGTSPSTSPTTSSPTARPTPSTSPAPAPDPLAGLTLEQCVGQLFMVGTPASGAAAATLSDVGTLHVGGVFLSGRSALGAAAAARVVAQLAAADHDGHPLLVATDQEGGEVQRLSGPGLSALPSALAQAALAPAALQGDAAQWGRELRASGVNMNLAPVADVVDSAQQAAANPPIGQLQREYGYGEASALLHARAFAQGMLQAGVVPVAKHFPGLGAVTANTDISAGVTDSVTTSASPSVGVYRGLIAAGLPAVMVSSAVYARIAPGAPGPFAPALVTGLLRRQLGFRGVVMTDDVAVARQLAAWSPAQRAVQAISSGVDIVLVSALPAEVPQMVAAVVAKARSDPAFANEVDASCTRVLSLKQRYLGDR